MKKLLLLAVLSFGFAAAQGTPVTRLPIEQRVELLPATVMGEQGFCDDLYTVGMRALPADEVACLMITISADITVGLIGSSFVAADYTLVREMPSEGILFQEYEADDGTVILLNYVFMGDYIYLMALLNPQFRG